MGFDIGCHLGRAAAFAGPLGTLVPGVKAIAALASFGVKLAGDADCGIRYQLPFADPDIPKPYGMFARPAALVPHPRSGDDPPRGGLLDARSFGIAIGEFVDTAQARANWKSGKHAVLWTSDAPLGAKYQYAPPAWKTVGFRVASKSVPQFFDAPLYTLSADQATKKTSAAFDAGVAVEILSPDRRKVTFEHPQRIGYRGLYQHTTRDIDQVWDELALVGVAQTLFEQGEDPAWAWWWSVTRKKLWTQENPRGLHPYFDAQDPEGWEYADKLPTKGLSLASTRLEDAGSIALQMRERVKQLRSLELGRIAEALERQKDAELVAQQVIEAVQSGAASADELAALLKQLTGAEPAQVFPHGDVSEPSPSGYPQAPRGQSKDLLLMGAALVVLALLVFRD